MSRADLTESLTLAMTYDNYISDFNNLIEKSLIFLGDHDYFVGLEGYSTSFNTEEKADIDAKYALIYSIVNPE